MHHLCVYPKNWTDIGRLCSTSQIHSPTLFFSFFSSFFVCGFELISKDLQKKSWYQKNCCSLIIFGLQMKWKVETLSCSYKGKFWQLAKTFLIWLAHRISMANIDNFGLNSSTKRKRSVKLCVLLTISE